MKLSEEYKFGFDGWGFLLFLLMVLPMSFVFVKPGPDSVLVTGNIQSFSDALRYHYHLINFILRTIIFVLLCFIVRREKVGLQLWQMGAIIAWVVLFYASATVSGILFLIFPCIALFLFAFWRKNLFKIIASVVFVIAHLYTFVFFLS